MHKLGVFPWSVGNRKPNGKIRLQLLESYQETNMSLKNILKEMIRQQGKVTTWQMRDIARKQNYTESNGERRCRELTREGFIRPIRNERKVITSYEWLNQTWK